ncbi:hypothetical protein DPM13_12650 [Paracoccus mutanolyticus]|uniref:Uncharacterized protein n=1 Tax=Paracoccus mutanolyticus TaxID=1499308 RepID=A0ABM6WSG4_9RHOB|nr:hypothetical protein DPM13_12650 [Paracoccus mutanolyticus]
MTTALPQIAREVGALYLDRIARTSGEIETLEQQIDEHAREHETLDACARFPMLDRLLPWPSRRLLRWRASRASGIWPRTREYQRKNGQ